MDVKVLERKCWYKYCDCDCDCANDWHNVPGFWVAPGCIVAHWCSQISFSAFDIALVALYAPIHAWPGDYAWWSAKDKPARLRFCVQYLSKSTKITSNTQMVMLSNLLTLHTLCTLCTHPQKTHQILWEHSKNKLRNIQKRLSLRDNQEILKYPCRTQPLCLCA